MFYNTTQPIGIIINSATENITGSLFITLLLIVLFLIAICLMFRIPVEFTIILILPLLLTVSAYSSDFISILGVLLIYLGIIFGKMFINR